MSALVAVLAAAISPAMAAGEDAWEQFRIDVEAACLAAAEPLFETAEATVDPFGSQSYGLALVRGKARGADVPIMAICVYDKQTKAVEIGGELADIASDRDTATAVPGPVLTASIEPCGDPCPIGPPLSEADAEEIRMLPARVSETLASFAADAALSWSGASQAALSHLAGEAPGDLAAIAPGDRECTVYWYGFLDEAGREVGHHRCAIEEGPDGLVLTKTTGELMRSVLMPLPSGAALAVGRTYLDGQTERTYDAGNPDNASNPNFGNYVGLAFADGDVLVVIDADQHGFQEPDPSYFAVLVVEPAD